MEPEKTGKNRGLGAKAQAPLLIYMYDDGGFLSETKKSRRRPTLARPPPLRCNRWSLATPADLNLL